MEEIKKEQNLTQNEDGTWSPAIPEPYYPNLLEKVTHFFGKHWYYWCDKCLLCGKKRKSK